EKSQNYLINESKESLFYSASLVLDKLTKGEIKEIIPFDNLLNPDYKLKLKDEKILESSLNLSRATSEQLYLAVRLSRIMDIKSKLPIILDDSFVNFDSVNLKNTLEVLKDISKTNQIFILTCHSEIVSLADNVFDNPKYYKIEDGTINNSDYKNLHDYLV
ncbi:MAG: ATP-binding protein, partial [Clostridiaceae bacterium]